MGSSSPSLLSFNHAGAMHPLYGLTAADIDSLVPSLERARREMLEEDARLFKSGKIPAEKQPLDHAFFDMPERLLKEYNQSPERSELGRILATVKRIKERVDKVVVLGIGGSYMGAKALLDSCCQPYYNELSRADRG